MDGLNFTPGQRWISETEPELGLGTVMQSDSGRVQLFFPASGEMRMYAEVNAPLKRVQFRTGDRVKTHDNQMLDIESVREEDGLLVYCGQGMELPEALLSDTISFHAAEDRLLNGIVDPIADFELRHRTLELRFEHRQSPVRGFAGGRIDLIPHQLYIAHEVSSRQAPRVLLSDEVGLGKTIEAGLIVHRLLLTGRAARVLVVVPDSLVHQWFVEMLRRFNIWLHIFDEERCEAIEAGAPDQNPFLDDQLVICSLSFLAGSEKRARQALSAGWDLLVVDEAHHLEWSPEQASPEYLLIEALSRQAEGLLLLTATPEQLGLESHFARLRLLDPDRYGDFAAFENEPAEFEAVANLVDHLEDGNALSMEDEAFIRQHFAHDPAGIDARLRALDSSDEEARHSMIVDLLDLYGPGRVIFRNTRAVLSDFPTRHAHLLPLGADSDQLQKAAVEFAIDAGLSEDRPEFDFSGDPRLGWLIDFLRDTAPEKALLICRSKEKALALHEALRQRVSIKAGVFHEDLSLVQRDRNAAWFAEEYGARLLICSEIGSEGRNFQFAHHLVLFDLPPHPEVLEQRIGRLDRIGQTRDIHLHVPFLANGPYKVLARWYHEGLDAFESSLEAGNTFYQWFGGRLLELAQASAGANAHRDLKQLVAETRKAHNTLQRQLDQGRDRLLEKNSYRPVEAGRLVRAVRTLDGDPRLQTYLLDVFDSFQIGYDEFTAGVFRVYPRPESSAVFATIPSDGVTITFDRKLALSREDYGFVTWDHPMITEAMDLILGSERGNSCAAVDASGAETLLLDTIFVLETVAEGRLHVDRFLPATPIHITITPQDDLVQDSFPERRLRAGDPSVLLSDPMLRQDLIPEMIRRATSRAEEQAESLRTASIDIVDRDLGHEFDRMKTLSQINPNIRSEELELTQQQQEKLKDAIRQARVRLDSVRMVVSK